MKAETYLSDIENEDAIARAGGIPPRPRSQLARLREVLGVTQRTMAERLGVSQQAYARLEKREARGSVSIDVLRRAAGALRCEMVYSFVPLPNAANSLRTLAERSNPVLRDKAAAKHTMDLEGQGSTK